jgi:hypothetical protein
MNFALFVDIVINVLCRLKSRDANMRGADKRKHDRLPLRLDLLCQRVGVGGNDIYTGKTINVSTGGVLFHVVNGKLSCDDLLNLELTVPPTEGLLELGGKMSTFARVVRVHHAHHDDKQHHAVAAEFLESPKFVG